MSDDEFGEWGDMKPAKVEDEIEKPRIPKQRRRRPPPKEVTSDMDYKDIVQRCMDSASQLSSTPIYVPKPKAPIELPKSTEPFHVRCVGHDDLFRGEHPRGENIHVDGIEVVCGNIVLLCTEQTHNGVWEVDDKNWKPMEVSGKIYVDEGEMYANTLWKKSNPMRDRLESARKDYEEHGSKDVLYEINTNPITIARKKYKACTNEEQKQKLAAEVRKLEALEYNICYDTRTDVNLNIESLQEAYPPKEDDGYVSPGEKEMYDMLKPKSVMNRGLTTEQREKLTGKELDAYERSRAYLALNKTPNRRK